MVAAPETSIDRLAQEWDELADHAHAHPFLRPGWIRAWTSAFANGLPLDVRTVEHGGELAAVLPLLRRRGGLVSPTNWHTPMGGVLARTDDDREELLASVLASRPRALTLSFLGPGLEQIRAAAARARYRLLEGTLQRSPTLALAGDWERYVATRQRKDIKEIERHGRRLAEMGDISFEVDEGLDRLEEGLRVEGSGWKIDAGTAILCQPSVAQFYRDVAAWAAARGTLRLFFLRLDGRPIAFEYALLDDGALYMLKGGYDPDLRAYGPGLQIASEMLRWSFEQGLRRFEFLGQEEPQKLQWTSDVHDLRRTQAFAPSPAGRLEHLAWERGRPLALAVARRVRDR